MKRLILSICTIMVLTLLFDCGGKCKKSSDVTGEKASSAACHHDGDSDKEHKCKGSDKDAKCEKKSECCKKSEGKKSKCCKKSKSCKKSEGEKSECKHSKMGESKEPVKKAS